jgi:hypothetical protein
MDTMQGSAAAGALPPAWVSMRCGDAINSDAPCPAHPSM